MQGRGLGAADRAGGVLDIAKADGLRRTGTFAGGADLAVANLAAVLVGGNLGDANALDAIRALLHHAAIAHRSEEHTSELQSLMRISYAVFCLKNKNQNKKQLY